jgi:hypothetical protein
MPHPASDERLTHPAGWLTVVASGPYVATAAEVTPGRYGARDVPQLLVPVLFVIADRSDVDRLRAHPTEANAERDSPLPRGASASTGVAEEIPVSAGVGCSFTSRRKMSGRA